MTAIKRRSLLVAFLIVPTVPALPALAQDALPDSRFVGFAQAVNDFDLASGNLAQARSANENIRGFATRAMSDARWEADALTKSRAEAGVSYAPDGRMGPRTADLLAQLNALAGPAFDAVYAAAQLEVQTQAEAQYGAYSVNGRSGPLKRYALLAFPKAKERRELAQRLAGGR
jgi:putative membrane protein